MGKFDEETYAYLSVKEYFADLMNAGCFGGEEVVAAGDLEELSGRTQEETEGKGRRSQYRDLRMRLQDGTSFVLLAVEDQANVDWEIPVRFMCYDAAEYRKQLEEIHRKKRRKREEAGLKRSRWAEKMDAGDRLHPIYTVCFYHGEGEWTGPKSLKEVMDFGENAGEWEPLFCNYRIKVINAEDAEVAKNCRTELRQFLEVMGARRNREKLKELLLDKAYENLSHETARIIAVVANVPDFLDNEEKYKNQEREGYNMCQAMEELKEEFKREGMATGRAEGRVEGRAEGREETSLKYLQNLMKTMHFSLEQAMNAVMVPEEDRPRLKQLLS